MWRRNGRQLALAAERGAQVSALDVAGNLLAIAGARVPNPDFHILVAGFNAFQCAANPGAALAEAKRVARPASHVVVMTWGKPEKMEAAAQHFDASHMGAATSTAASLFPSRTPLA